MLTIHFLENFFMWMIAITESNIVVRVHQLILLLIDLIIILWISEDSIVFKHPELYIKMQNSFVNSMLKSPFSFGIASIRMNFLFTQIENLHQN